MEANTPDTRIDVMPQDNAHMQALEGQIIKGELTTPEAISAAVGLLNFSSIAVREHTRRGILALFEAGAYDSPTKPIELEAVDTDAHAA